jgi:hypothetical protein
MKQCLNDMKAKDEMKLRNKELSTESDQLQQEMEEKGRQLEDFLPICLFLFAMI